MSEQNAQPQDWRARLQAAKAALAAGNRVLAQAHLDAAAALAPGDPLELRLLRADLLVADGAPEVAETVLRAAAQAFPGNLWPPLRRAQLARARGDHIATRHHLATAQALDPEGRVAPLSILAADIALADGDAAAAASALAALLRTLPGHPGLPSRLVRLSHLPGGADPETPLARPLIETALAHHPEHLVMTQRLAQLELDGNAADAAIARLDALLTRHPDRPEIALHLARALRQLNRPEAEDAALLRAIAADPADPGLLRHLFATQATKAHPDALTRALDALAGRIDPDLGAELRLYALIQTMQFDEALDALRAATRRRDNPAAAQQLATCLFGTGRYRLGLRYLAAALQRWPRAPGLVSLFVVWGLKLGRRTAVAQVIERAAESLPSPVVAAHRLMLAGMANDLDTAAAEYEILRAAGRLTKQQRDILAKLIFHRAPLDCIDALQARIGTPAGETGAPLHRGGLPGMLTLELTLERAEFAAGGGWPGAAEWLRARPGSALAAIRVIDDWTETTPSPTEPPAPPPPRIFQYWNSDAPPALVQQMTATWARAPGFSHQLLSRAQARRFLRDHHGRDRLQAFDLARNPAEEADLLRLCLLLSHGGIWADADDRLYGDLTAALAPTSGLVVYREPLGGALGNNFLAAPQGHPALERAADMVTQALLERSADISWSKTGPGVLTRAVAHYLLETPPEAARRGLTLLDGNALARCVAMHNPVRYKSLPEHWEQAGARARISPLWPALLDALAEPLSPASRS